MQRLQARGLLQLATEGARELRKGCKVYAGFDPTADSLHLGNLVVLTALRQFELAGHRPVVLLGGATGMIGDPSGRDSERAMLSAAQVSANVEGIGRCVSRVLDDPLVLNNADWHGQLDAVSWMRDFGRHFRVSAMLSRESVRARLDSPQGISFTEFAYQVFQGADFLHLADHHNVGLQVGGSDQWGNIVAGVELVRRSGGSGLTGVHGVTVPLLTTAAGVKFGKSAGNALWLNADRTSPFALFQYLLDTDDADAERLLLALAPEEAMPDVPDALAEHVRAPHERAAQRLLAQSVTRMLHGVEGLESAERATEVLFGSGSGSGSSVVLAADLEAALEPGSVDGPLEGRAAVELAVVAGLCKSKGEARRLAKGGGLYVGHEAVGPAHVVAAEQVIDGRAVLLRAGRRRWGLAVCR